MGSTSNLLPSYNHLIINPNIRTGQPNLSPLFQKSPTSHANSLSRITRGNEIGIPEEDSDLEKEDDDDLTFINKYLAL